MSGNYFWTKDEWIEDQLDSPLYGGRIIIAGGPSDRFGETLYFEFDCPETYEMMKGQIGGEYGMVLSIMGIDEMPDQFEIMRTVTAADIPCDRGQYHSKATWLWSCADDSTVIAVDDNDGTSYFEFENDVTWQFFKGIAESRYGASLRQVPHDQLPELFVIVMEWCEYDI